MIYFYAYPIFKSRKYHLTVHQIGKPAPAKFDDWSVSLQEAKGDLARMAKAVEDSILTVNLTLISANTCSASLATLPIVASRIPDVKVLWIDAHTDFNTPETTKSGYLGGMVVAAACGLWDSGHGAGLDPNQVAFVGARDIDAAEKITFKC